MLEFLEQGSIVFRVYYFCLALVVFDMSCVLLFIGGLRQCDGGSSSMWRCLGIKILSSLLD